MAWKKKYNQKLFEVNGWDKSILSSDDYKFIVYRKTNNDIMVEVTYKYAVPYVGMENLITEEAVLSVNGSSTSISRLTYKQINLLCKTLNLK